MKSKLTQAGLAALLLVLLTGMLALALVGGVNGRFAVTGGGGQLQKSGVHLMAAIGQPVAGAAGSSTGDVVLCSGLVCGGRTLPPGTEYRVYLPTIVKSAP